jgi:hypothetical protein
VKKIMKPNEHESMDRSKISPDVVDREIDAVLANYSSVEPRPGLEERIMANLSAERERPPARLWWRWPSTAVLALVVLALATSTEWRTNKAPRNQTAGTSRHGTATPRIFSSAPVSARSGIHSSALSKPPRQHVANLPKLDTFPSPQPLSEQEKVLADYVARFRQEAVLIARVNTEESIRDRAEMTGGSGASTDLSDFDEKETTNR